MLPFVNCISELRDMLVFADDCSYMNITIVIPGDESRVRYYKVLRDLSEVCRLQPYGSRSCVHWVHRCSSNFIYEGQICYNTGQVSWTCGNRITRGGWTPPQSKQQQQYQRYLFSRYLKRFVPTLSPFQSQALFLMNTNTQINCK